MLKLKPVSLKEANNFVALHHRQILFGLYI